jgi:hypothetical protein
MLRGVAAAGGFLMLAGLAGCQTMSAEELAYADDQECQSYGTKPGTSAYVECRMALRDIHAGEEERRRRGMAVFLQGVIDAGHDYVNALDGS